MWTGWPVYHLYKQSFNVLWHVHKEVTFIITTGNKKQQRNKQNKTWGTSVSPSCSGVWEPYMGVLEPVPYMGVWGPYIGVRPWVEVIPPCLFAPLERKESNSRLNTHHHHHVLGSLSIQCFTCCFAAASNWWFFPKLSYDLSKGLCGALLQLRKLRKMDGNHLGNPPFGTL